MVRHADHPVVRSGLPEPVGGCFGIVAKALLALAKCRLDPLAVLDIGSRPIPFDNVASLVAHRLSLEQEPAILTIEAPEPSFKSAWHTGLPYCAPLLQHALLVVRVKSAGPASCGLVQREAGIIEGSLIKEVGDPFRSGPPDQGGDCVDHQSEAIFGSLDFIESPLQFRLCLVLLGDIHVRIHQFGYIAVAVCC